MESETIRNHLNRCRTCELYIFEPKNVKIGPQAAELGQKGKNGFTVPIPHAFQCRFFHGWHIFPGKLMHFKNSFLHGLSPPKSFIKKFLLDKKLWLFQNRVQVAPSTSCLPGSKGFSWDYSCFQGLYGQNTKAIRSKKAKQSAKTKVKLRFNLGLT